MHGSVKDDEIVVMLSYRNVRQLAAAIERMRPNNNNVFTLSKRQDDGTMVSVVVLWEDENATQA